MPHWLALAMSVVLVCSACAEQPREPDTLPAQVAATAGTSTTTTVAALSSSTTTATTTTTASTTAAASSTTTTTTVVSQPAFLRYGSFGVIEVEAGRETVLVEEPVASAWSDGAGGLVLRNHWRSEVPGIWRLPAGTDEPFQAAPEYLGIGAVVNLDGRAAVVRYDDWEEPRCESGSIGVYDLETGLREDFVVCSGEGDVGWFPSTYGGGLFAGVRWEALGSCGTDSGILFWDRSGAPADVATNPYPVSLDEGPGISGWIPCELDARLSPDGRLLAYRFRPDNKWPCPEYDDVLYEVWLEESGKILGEVVVIDIETGSVVYQAPSEAEERLTDFDGRYLVLTTVDSRDDLPHPVSTIVDATGTNPDLTVDGRVRLIWTAT